MNWQRGARRRQSARRLGFFAALTLFFLTWIGTAALAGWVYGFAFGPISERRLAEMFVGIGAVLSAVFLKWGPTLPFAGRAPEEEAARAFFAGEDVRSDDDRFETDLKP